ncbi:zinc ribbon domain-containing protein [Rhodopirellula sp. JC740]|uniref:Zinc ribbon domain-containing protein n=1 Tax=Rhodopirellula halodulae TaxID=2894198 RepID=A0ABS8NIS9_9BACT|nr:zinc ribbon domain-containing protein [Rhodopirellula sp. JC740]MCC9643465.1 zinc ribbon domain-containing protein [Rhodopirellula sp. JC740]
MILIGTMNLTRTLESGEFYCPTCNSIQGQRTRSKRPFLTLYFIPTIPIGNPEPFVQCDGCKSSWDLSVLSMDQKTHERVRANQFRNEAIRASVLITLEDDEITEPEIQSLLRISSQILDHPIDREELGRLCSVATQSNIRTNNYVLTVSKRWTMQQRLTALQAMFLAATSCQEEVSDAKIQRLAEMEEILELTESEFEAVIEDSVLFANV